MDKPQRLAQRQERAAARSYDGRVTPASGSRDSKGDVESDTELIECKHTERKSYSLKLLDLLKLARQAILRDRRMVLEIEFTQPDGTRAVKFVVLNKDEYVAMKDEIADLYEKVAALRAELRLAGQDGLL